MKIVYQPVEVALAMKHIDRCFCGIEPHVIDLRCVGSYAVPAGGRVDPINEQVGVPRCPVDGQWCNTCPVGGSNGAGGQCARMVYPKPLAVTAPVAERVCGHGRRTLYNLSVPYCRHADGDHSDCDIVTLMKPCPCATREDHDGERIRTHCAAHCPRVRAGDWSECRGC